MCVCVRVCVQGEGSRSKVVLVKEVLSKLSKEQYSIEELTRKPLPEGVDPLRLEDYLADHDFKVRASEPLPHQMHTMALNYLHNMCKNTCLKDVHVVSLC